MHLSFLFFLFIFVFFSLFLNSLFRFVFFTLPLCVFKVSERRSIYLASVEPRGMYLNTFGKLVHIPPSSSRVFSSSCYLPPSLLLFREKKKENNLPAFPSQTTIYYVSIPLAADQINCCRRRTQFLPFPKLLLLLLLLPHIRRHNIVQEKKKATKRKQQQQQLRTKKKEGFQWLYSRTILTLIKSWTKSILKPSGDFSLCVA